MAPDVNPAGYIETVPVRPHTDQQSRDAAAEEMRAEMARRKVGMNELARRIGKDPKWVQNRANGRTSITVEDIPLLAAGLGMTPQDLGHALVDQLPAVESFADERDRRAGIDANAQKRGQVTRSMKREITQNRAAARALTEWGIDHQPDD